MNCPIRRSGMLPAACLALLALPALPVHAQATRPDAALPAADAKADANAGIKANLTAGTAADLYRRAAPPRTAPLRIGRGNAERDWKDNTVPDARRDDDACLLSVSLGGTLDVRGYKGVRLFGGTRTLSRPAAREVR